MRKLLALIAFLLASSPAWATWTLTQVKDNAVCTGSTTCSVTVTATGAGHLLILAMSASTSVTLSGATGGTFTHCSNCAGGNSTSGYVDMGYIASATGSTTSIAFTYSGGACNTVNCVAAVWEFSTTSTGSFDVSGGALDSTNCTSCAGTALSLTGSNDAIATLATCGGTCSAVTPYTNDLSNPNGDVVGHAINTASGTAPTLTQSPTSNLYSGAIAFKESGGGTSKPAMPVVY